MGYEAIEQQAAKMGLPVYQYMRIASQRALRLTCALNNTYHEPEEVVRLFSELIGRPVGEDFCLFPPFYTDYGYNCRIGEETFLNHNAYLMDGALITIGKHCFIGPNCGMYTANHPLVAEERNQGLEQARPITIGDNVWIGADVTILPGVTIGEGSVIGAKSVVTKDIPPNVIALGNPCRVLRAITEADRVQKADEPQEGK